MALSRGRLTDNVINVSDGSTVGILTVADNKKIYVKSMLAHNTSGVTTATASIYYVPNGDSVGTNTRVFEISVDPEESIFIEPSYPIVLTNTGDGMSAKATSAQINFLFTGDKEV